MKRALLLPIVLVALAACADPSTGPTRGPSPSAPRLDIVALNAPNGAHYRQGNGDPVCSIAGITVSCTGTAIAGVGNTDGNLLLTVAYGATCKCRNHGGQIVEVKTQNVTKTPAPDDATDLRNGTLYVRAFSASSVPTTQDFLDAATCPNGNWTKELKDGSPSVTSFTYTLTFDGFNLAAITVTGP